MKTITLILAASALLAGTLAQSDPPATHGMLLFGNQVTYASHLPMFHAPHDYQVIMKLSLESLPHSQTLVSYEKLKANGVTFFTLEPQKVDLTQVINGTKKTLSA